MPRHVTRTSFQYNPEAHIKLICVICGKEFERIRAEVNKQLRKNRPIRFCSMKCMGLGRVGSNNAGWKGDNVGKRAVHDWIKRNLIKPKLCQYCQSKPPRDLANITGVYNRDLSNWRYLCKSCHAIYDGSISNIPRVRF